MKIEIRADGVHISGYVNVTEKKSRPVITPHGRVVEEIEPRAFEKALGRAENVPMTKDHDPAVVLAETRAGSLRLYEDEIGLHYDADITDAQTIEEARAGKIRGLSFGMRNVIDILEERAEDLPLRRIKDLDLDHIALVVNRMPVYSATSVEVRADAVVDIETRTTEKFPQIMEVALEKCNTPSFDNSAYHSRIEALKNEKNGGIK